MFKVLKTRIKQKYRTIKYPSVLPEMPDRYRGLPCISGNCEKGCIDCINICPVNAIFKDQKGKINIDLGRCIFCGECEEICKKNVITFTDEHRMTTGTAENLIISEGITFKHADSLSDELLKIFKRSFKLREVSAGGCNACESDVNVLGTVGYDLGRFGISFVASPRHADALLVTGPVTENMKEALIKTYNAIPEPKIVIATGACAVSGGLFSSGKITLNGVDKVIPVSYYIPGCPPHPLTILDGLLTICSHAKKEIPAQQ